MSDQPQPKNRLCSIRTRGSARSKSFWCGCRVKESATHFSVLFRDMSSSRACKHCRTLYVFGPRATLLRVELVKGRKTD